MAKQLNYIQFLDAVARKAGYQPAKVRKIWEAIVEVIYDELSMGNSIWLRNFGKLYTRFYEAGDKNCLGNIYFVEEHVLPKIKFSNNFIDYINGRRISPDGKKRERLGITSGMDKRMQRAYEKRNSENVTKLLQLKKESGKNIIALTKEQNGGNE